MSMLASADVNEQSPEAIAAESETMSGDCGLDAPRLDAFLADDFHEFGRFAGR